ncbi:MAG TPA: GNAT family N-acetyltransferase [Thermoanaerobaculia bacterium]|nr:GNAT family N-acetyltransferase [Thermoanaerobaculia bacterium]
MTFRAVHPSDLPRLVEINNAVVPAMNELDLEAMRRFAETALWFRVAEEDGTIAAFLIALQHDAEYDSANFRWFQSHYGDFVYVDRIAVDPSARRLGLASRLYGELFDFARSRGAPRICAEVNLRPPNPVSIEFHRRAGFLEVGTLDHADSGKRVVLLVKPLEAGS